MLVELAGFADNSVESIEQRVLRLGGEMIGSSVRLDHTRKPIVVHDDPAKPGSEATVFLDAFGRGEPGRIGAVLSRLFNRSVRIHDNPRVTDAGPVCFFKNGVGDLQDITRLLKHPELMERGLTGKGVYIAVVDAGIDSASMLNRLNRDPISYRWSVDASARGTEDATVTPRDFSKPVSRSHGTIVGALASTFAPKASIVDVCVFGPLCRQRLNALTSDLLAGFVAVLRVAQSIRRDEPHARIVVNCSTQICSGPSIFGAMKYPVHRQHPLYRFIDRLAAAQIDVVMPSGNCQHGRCIAAECGSTSVSRISGINGHPAVITVGAVDAEGSSLGYSLQGPAEAEGNQKPDTLCYSHFELGNASQAEVARGTSFASPILAGILASARTPDPRIAQPSVQEAIRYVCDASRSSGSESPALIDTAKFMALMRRQTES